MQNSRLVKYGTQTLTAKTFIIFDCFIAKVIASNICISMCIRPWQKHCFSYQINDERMCACVCGSHKPKSTLWSMKDEGQGGGGGGNYVQYKKKDFVVACWRKILQIQTDIGFHVNITLHTTFSYNKTYNFHEAKMGWWKKKLYLQTGKPHQYPVSSIHWL